MTSVEIGKAPWDRESMLSALQEFAGLYEARPIRNNQGGMKAPHMFLLWFVLRELKPDVIIESGVWRGQGTWLIEQACPESELYCLDVTWKRLEFRSTNAKYIRKDMARCDWDHLAKDRTLVFFDDHVSAFERIRLCAEIGFKQILFEDNYPPGVGDFYSLKKAFMHAGHSPASSIKDRIRRVLGRLNDRAVPPNREDAEYLRSVIETYVELPPIFKTKETRWGTTWDYPTERPLVSALQHAYQQVFLDDAQSYNWMCYVQLKDDAALGKR